MVEKLDILICAVHPDDAELACSGTIVKEIAQGKKVGIVDFTSGQLGTRGTSEIRLKEAQEASKILGLTIRENLGFEDGYFQNDAAHQAILIKTIRKYQPEIIIANAREDRHPDHGRASKLTEDSIFYSGLRKIETYFDNGQAQEPWRPKNLFFYIQDRYLKPDFVIDITEFIDTKEKAIRCFKSQFFDPESNEPESYISSPEFFKFIIARAEELGHYIGCKYGEGFQTSKFLKVNHLFDIL